MLWKNHLENSRLGVTMTIKECCNARGRVHTMDTGRDSVRVCDKPNTKGSSCRVLSLVVRTRKGKSRLGIENNSRLGADLCRDSRGYSLNYHYGLSYQRELWSQRSCAHHGWRTLEWMCVGSKTKSKIMEVAKILENPKREITNVKSEPSTVNNSYGAKAVANTVQGTNRVSKSLFNQSSQISALTISVKVQKKKIKKIEKKLWGGTSRCSTSRNSYGVRESWIKGHRQVTQKKRPVRAVRLFFRQVGRKSLSLP